MSEIAFVILKSGKILFDGVEFEAAYVVELKKKYQTKLKLYTRQIEAITRSKALGAPEDGIETVVGAKITADYAELLIDVPLEIEIEIREKVQNSSKGWDLPTLDSREPRV